MGIHLDIDPIHEITSVIKNYAPDTEEYLKTYWTKHLRPKIRRKYLDASARTPYALSSYGKRKRSGSIIPDGRYGIDTKALYRDVTERPEINSAMIVIGSSLDYASRMDMLFREKSPYPDGVWNTDTQDEAKLKSVISNEIRKDVEQVMLTDARTVRGKLDRRKTKIKRDARVQSILISREVNRRI